MTLSIIGNLIGNTLAVDSSSGLALNSFVAGRVQIVNFALSSGAITPVGSALAGGEIGAAYSETISVSGGTSPFTFSILSGSLPPGLTLDASSGIISGTPTTVGSYSVVLEVTDSTSATGSFGFTIAIAASSSSTAAANSVHVY